MTERKKLSWKYLEEEDDSWVERLWTNPEARETVDASEVLTIPLEGYQQEWLAWALKQEESSARGGILDDIGMGKTLQAIALVLLERKRTSSRISSSACSSSVELPKTNATLVVCPLINKRQWLTVIERFTHQGSTKFLAYNGADRPINLSDYDFVITTYSVVEADFRKFVDSSSIENVENSVLYSVAWKRIILDEAHRVNTTRPVLAIQSSYRWALSGTSFQEPVEELQSLVRFLQIFPCSYHFCKVCEWHTLGYRQIVPILHNGRAVANNLPSPISGDCPDSPHTLNHFCWWERYISHPLTYGESEDVKRAVHLLKHKILKSVVLIRRTLPGRAPPTIEISVPLHLDNAEKRYYTKLYKDFKTEFDTYIESRKVKPNYTRILYLLGLLRQAVNHSYLVEYSRDGKVTGFKREEICSSCVYPADIMAGPCGHFFCKSCFSNAMGQNLCPSCPKPLTFVIANEDGEEQSSETTIKEFRASSILNHMPLDKFSGGTKIDCLKQEVGKMAADTKGVVFSQFSSFLDLIHFALLEGGVPCVQFDVSMSVGARDAAIKKFTEDPKCRIFLANLSAGGLALDLSVASHVFLMEPLWNPAVDLQAVDTVLRMGQYDREVVRVVRFSIEGTIEDRILELRKVFNRSKGASSEEVAELIEAYLRELRKGDPAREVTEADLRERLVHNPSELTEDNLIILFQDPRVANVVQSV